MLIVTARFKLHPTRRPVAEMATGASRADDYGSSTWTGPAEIVGRLPVA
jgi:hypothetical protein